MNSLKLQLLEVGIISVARIGKRNMRLPLNSVKPQLLEVKYQQKQESITKYVVFIEFTKTTVVKGKY